MASEIVFVTNAIVKNLGELEAKERAYAAVVVDHQATLATANMKIKAPWKDRTGNARATLEAEAEHHPDSDLIVLHGGVPYQIWLETRWSGKFAVIGPEVKRRGKYVMAEMSKMLSAMRGAK